MTLLQLLTLIVSVLFYTKEIFYFSNESLSQSKIELQKIHHDHQTSIYCDCKYSYKDDKNMIDKESCGYIPRIDSQTDILANRIEWEHIIPLENFGRQFVCWREGYLECVNSKEEYYKGRRCCDKINQKFRIMQADMHNLQPVIGELNRDRKNYRFNSEKASPNKYGECKFDVNFKLRRAYIKEDIRGLVARTYLYFHKRYEMKMSKKELKQYKEWNEQYPPSKWEIERNKRIAKIQGNTNGFIK